ncbi:hypothetical protein B0H14DRAFT_3452124 [Mycena olivaceomarginata]|nr:hypothetical protein B0H14DRAFT_3452124 [Mycena olivaceomarginata]
MHASSSSPAHVLLPHRARFVASPDQSDSSYVVRDVRVPLAYDELPVRGTLASPSSFIRPLVVRDQGQCSAVCPPLEPSPLRHAIAIHLIRIRVTSLTDSITVTATCTLSLDPFCTGCQRTCRRSRCLAEYLCSMPPSAWATLSSSVCPTVSNAAGSSQDDYADARPFQDTGIPHVHRDADREDKAEI